MIITKSKNPLANVFLGDEHVPGALKGVLVVVIHAANSQVGFSILSLWLRTTRVTYQGTLLRYLLRLCLKKKLIVLGFPLHTRYETFDLNLKQTDLQI